MTGGTGRAFALALALCIAGAARASPQVVDAGATRRALDNPAVLARDAELSAFAGSGRADELAARLDIITFDATLDAVAREWLIDRGLHRLGRLPPTPAARTTVARLAGRKPVVYARIDPDHGDRATPLYDAGATARFVLREWNRRHARAEAEALLAAGDPTAVERYAAIAALHGRSAQLKGIADAFRDAPARRLATQRPALHAALENGERVGPLALIAAERLADPGLFGLVLQGADEASALAAVSAAARTLDSRTALSLLEPATHRTDIGSAALLALGGLATGDADARDALFTALSDPPRAPSAAAALARLADPAVSAELGQRLAAAKSEQSRRAIVLALRLDATPAARVELERFAQSGAGSPQLRRQVDAWLAP
jgi:hypothetical protein